MPWVLTTPLGQPVEPELNRILATVSCPVAAKASSTTRDGIVAIRLAKATTPSSGPKSVTATFGMAPSSMAATAGAYRRHSWAKTMEGRTASTTRASLEAPHALRE